MEIKVTSNDCELVQALVSIAAENRSAPESSDLALAVGNPEYVPGAVESWWELLATLGVIGFPLSVVGNLLASWIWQALTRAHSDSTLHPSPASAVKLIIRDGDRFTEIYIQSTSLPAIRAAVQSALKDVYPQQ